MEILQRVSSSLFSPFACTRTHTMQHASPLVRRICALAMLCKSRRTHVRGGENTAFVIAGQCRANPKGLKLCRERGAVLQQLASYKRFVFDSLGSSPSSDGRNHPGRNAMFLMMKDTLLAFPDTPCAAVCVRTCLSCYVSSCPSRPCAGCLLVFALAPFRLCSSIGVYLDPLSLLSNSAAALMR